MDRSHHFSSILGVVESDQVLFECSLCVSVCSGCQACNIEKLTGVYKIDDHIDGHIFILKLLKIFL